MCPICILRPRLLSAYICPNQKRTDRNNKFHQIGSSARVEIVHYSFAGTFLFGRVGKDCISSRGRGIHPTRQNIKFRSKTVRYFVFLRPENAKNVFFCLHGNESFSGRKQTKQKFQFSIQTT